MTDQWLTPPISALKPGVEYLFHEDFSSQYSFTAAQRPPAEKSREMGGEGLYLRTKMFRVMGMQTFFGRNPKFSIMPHLLSQLIS